MAIAPNERNKFFLKQELLELVLANNVRKNDIIMNFAPNKYYLLLFDIDKKSAEKLWTKIREQIPEKIYAGIVEIFNQGRRHIIDAIVVPILKPVRRLCLSGTRKSGNYKHIHILLLIQDALSQVQAQRLSFRPQYL
jgi:hypothetical protein